MKAEAVNIRVNEMIEQGEERVKTTAMQHIFARNRMIEQSFSSILAESSYSNRQYN